jgi:hypothetical protein
VLSGYRGGAADARVKDTLLVSAGAAGLATVTVVVLALVTGLSWWIAVFTTANTLVIGSRYLQERWRFGRDSDEPTSP